MRLKDKVALISGAARGIGLATAVRFAQEKARVVLFDVDGAEGQRALAKVSKEDARAVFIQGDISRSADVRRAVAETAASFGRLDLLVNSAGVLWIGKDLPVAELEEEVWNQVIAINLTGAFLMCKYAIPEMIRAGGGSIVNIASVSAFKGWGVAGAYGPSKGGVMSMTRDMAIAYAPHNIRVNAICPGNIDTPMVSSLADDPRWQAGIAKTPLKRLGQPKEIADLAVYLCTDEASFITGAGIIADGGLTAG